MQKPRVSETDFEDLLCNHGFSSKADRKGPRTIAEMRRQEQARDTDPLKLKVPEAAAWVPSGQGFPDHLPTSRMAQRSGGHGPVAPWGPGVPEGLRVVGCPVRWVCLGTSPPAHFPCRRGFDALR